MVAGEKDRSVHLKRWLTGIVALPILIYLIGFGPRWVFYLLLTCVCAAGLAEFYRMTAPHLPRPVRWSGFLLSLLLLLLVYSGDIYLLLPATVLFAFVPMACLMLLPHSPDPMNTGDMGRALLGPAYIALPLAMLMIVDRYPRGNMWIFFLLAVIFASDTGAFYFGRLFGRHKLYEAVSPGKTWEGAIGGVLSSIIVAFWFLRILHFHPVDVSVLALAAGLSAAGQVGDLVESMIKRSHGVKDSGRILPGHGGVLDRIDGLLFAIPLLYMYLYLP
jgi:phosphatidate cytidylyltransferase